LLVGGLALQRAVQVPSALILALNGLVVVFVVATDRYRKRMLERNARVDLPEPPPRASVSAPTGGPEPPGEDTS
jgi:simple sugar transport system permease protein